MPPTDHLSFRSLRPKYSIANNAAAVDATIATVLEKPISDLKPAYRSSFHVIKIPVAIKAIATSIQCCPDEKPNSVASLTSQSAIDIPSKREGTIARLHTPYEDKVQIGLLWPEAGHCAH
jgi:hypothetical protein